MKAQQLAVGEYNILEYVNLLTNYCSAYTMSRRENFGDPINETTIVALPNIKLVLIKIMCICLKRKYRSNDPSSSSFLTKQLLL